MRSREGAQVPFRVLIDGEAPGPAHGLDVDASGQGTLVEPRLYQLVREPGADRRPHLRDRLREPPASRPTCSRSVRLARNRSQRGRVNEHDGWVPAAAGRKGRAGDRRRRRDRPRERAADGPRGRVGGRRGPAAGSGRRVGRHSGGRRPRRRLPWSATSATGQRQRHGRRLHRALRPHRPAAQQRRRADPRHRPHPDASTTGICTSP